MNDKDKSVGNLNIFEDDTSYSSESWNATSTSSLRSEDREGGENVGEVIYTNHAHLTNPIRKIAGAHTTFPLYCSPSTLPSLLSATHFKSFNQGLAMLLVATRDLSDLARQKDRTATLPHPIVGVGGGEDMTIGGVAWSVKRDGKEENFNRASKFFLTNLKWIVAFHTKQHM